MLKLGDLSNVESIYEESDKLFYLLRTKDTKDHQHMLIFLSEDGESRVHMIKNVYPHFLIRNHSVSQVQHELEFNGIAHLVKGVEPVERRNPATDEPEKLIKVETWKPTHIGNKYAPDTSVDYFFNREDVVNIIPYYHQVLIQSGFIMGFPYRFEGKKPVFADDGLEEERHLYDEVIANLAEEDKFLGEATFRLLHSRLPNWAKMIMAGDIEVHGNYGETFDPDRAELPISSISATTDKATDVFVLESHVLGNTPPPDPSIFDDGSFKRHIYGSEKELLTAFNVHVEQMPQKIDIWYNGDRFDLPYLNRRNEIHKIQSGLKVTKKDNRWYHKNWKNRYLMDIHAYFNNNNVKTGAYLDVYENLKLGTVGQGVLGRTKYEYEGEIAQMSMEELSFYNAKDTQLTFDLATHDNNFPAFILFFIMRFGNLSLENANRRGITSWWGGFLYRLLAEGNYFIPNDSMLYRSQEKIAGGKVIDAVPGLHNDVRIIDFASLYPTLIVRKNIDFSTINCEHQACMAEKIYLPKCKEEVHTCTQRRGFIPRALNFFREARVNIYKKKASEDDFYKNLSQFIKIFMNAAYGALKNAGFAFAHRSAAGAVTAYGRKALTDLEELVEREGANALYGDSITATQAVVVKVGASVPMVMSIEHVWAMMTDRQQVLGNLADKERMIVDGLQVWNGDTFTKVRSLIRHATMKTTYRVATGTGIVDVTEDHSLVDDEGLEFRPSLINKGRSPASSEFNLVDRDLLPIPSYDLVKLQFLFSMNGTASQSKSGFKSQRTVALHFHQRLIDKGTEFFSDLIPLIDSLGAKHKVYTSKEGKMVVKFSAQNKLWSIIRKSCYIGDKKMKPSPAIFGLPDDELKFCYEYLLDYYAVEDKFERYIIPSSAEMVVFSAMAKYFGDDFIFAPIPKRNKYNVRRASEAYRKKTTVAILTLPPDIVYDLETQDGTFMAGNIKCHNTDSVFVTGEHGMTDEQMSDILDLDVETEDFFERFLQHKKKNYLKIRKDGTITIKGMVGKKKHVPKIIRRAFQEAIDGIVWDMSEQEMRDMFMDVWNKYKVKLNARNFTSSDIQITGMMSKDICSCPDYRKVRKKNKLVCINDEHYKMATPIVTAVKQKRLEYAIEGDSRQLTFGRKGSIVDFVKAGNTWKVIEDMKKHEINVGHYIEQLEGVFSQLVDPFGDEIAQVITERETASLDEFF